MDLVHRIWSKEEPVSTLNLSLAERLKQLSGQVEADEPATEADAQAEPSRADAAAAATTDGSAAAGAEVRSGAAAATNVRTGEQEASKAAKAPKNPSETPVTEGGPTAAAAPSTGEVAVASPNEKELPKGVASSSAALPDAANTKPDNGKRFFRAPRWGSKPEKPANGDSPEANRVADSSAGTQPPEPSAESPAEPVAAAVDGGGPTAENALVSVQQALAELQTARQQFESEIRDRLDGAIADYQQRLATDTLAGDAAGQFEEKTKQATDKIFHEVKAQAWTMLNAVAGELRAFRDQFGQEVREHSGQIEEATRQAMQVRDNLNEALPLAREILQSLPQAGQEAAEQVRAASSAAVDEMQSSHQSLSAEIENQKNALKSLLQGCHEDEARLKEEIEKFRAEVGAAGEAQERTAGESLERLRSGAQETDTRLRSGLEELAGQIEQHLLSAELVDKATAQIETAAQQNVVEPALERIQNACSQADNLTESINRTSQGVIDRLGSARQQIESRLDALITEQRAVLESSMNGLHRKAAEELGNVVERAVAQSSQQLDDRLRSLFDNLLSSTSEQINGATRATLDTLHDGLKDVFEPETEKEIVDQAEVSRES